MMLRTNVKMRKTIYFLYLIEIFMMLKHTPADKGDDFSFLLYTVSVFHSDANYLINLNIYIYFFSLI